MNESINIFWFRRDLRLEDNHGLFEALKNGKSLLPIFIFDLNILKELPRDDARVTFIWDCIDKINARLKSISGGEINVFHGEPNEVFRQLLEQFPIAAVYTNTDYEPYALERDENIKQLLKLRQIPFLSFKDHVIFEKKEIVKDDGMPYVVYTPYMKKWKSIFRLKNTVDTFESAVLLKDATIKIPEHQNPGIEKLGFKRADISVPDYHLESELIENYASTRDFPAVNGTSHLGPHLRFGTISVRQALKSARKAQNETFWNELIWREFFTQILWHFPNTVHKAFKSQYDNIKWRNDAGDFEKWKSGNTGFALVDAGMRDLNKTGYMHNRVRMLVASFLCKHLLIDWRWGEAYFAEKLLDFELASNVGNWQWAAGSGVDAAPYFRIFNPETQILKFDKEMRYIRKWVPEFGTSRYSKPMVDHKIARERCLDTYKSALQ
jgi:deoxyribodipyrimidine photo-lyase